MQKRRFIMTKIEKEKLTMALGTIGDCMFD